MYSLGTLDVIDSVPNENVVNSGVNADHAVELSVIPTECPNTEEHSPSTPQVDSDISDSISIATVVEPIGDHTADPIPASPEPIVVMPKSINLDDLALHSPSSLAGTPFANDNTRFEYPFPDTNQGCGSGSSSATSGFSSPETSTSPTLSSFPTLSTSSSQMLTQLSLPPSSHRPSYNVTHPRMKVQANPPIPPNLIKRRLRWSLSLLGRRRSSAGSQQSTISDESTTANITDEQQAASSPGSPIQERVKR